MPSWKLSIGSYDLPAGFYPVNLDQPLDLAPSRLPRQPGAVTQEARADARTVVIMGSWYADTLAGWESARDAILAGIPAQGNLYVGRDDRYYKDAQLSTWSQSTPADGRLWAILGTLQLPFLCSDPHLFDSATNTPTLTNTGGTIVYSASQGNADTYPTWTITANAGGTGTITLASTTTGETCLVKKPDGTNFASSDVIVLDSLNKTAKLNGVILPGLHDRRIPRLVPGSNTITLADSGTLTITSLACSYPGRWK